MYRCLCSSHCRNKEFLVVALILPNCGCCQALSCLFTWDLLSVALAFIPTSAVQPVRRLDVPQFLLEVERVQRDAAEVGERHLCLRAELGYKIQYSLVGLQMSHQRPFNPTFVFCGIK